MRILCHSLLALALPALGHAQALTPSDPLPSDDAAAAHGPALRVERTSSAAALVDADGKLIGRLSGNRRVLLQYKGAPLTVALSDANQPPDGGLEWQNGPSIYYTSGNCSGQEYVPIPLFGTNYFGTVVKENGHSTLLVGDVSQNRLAPILSVYELASARCVVLPRPSLTHVVQIQARLALDAFATEPMFIR